MDTKYLKKRQQGWYVYIRVPAHLEQTVGKKHITRSLGTRDLKQANKLKYQAIAEVNAYFESIQKASNADTPLSKLTTAAKMLSKEIKLNNADPEQMYYVWSEMLDRYLDKHHERDQETGEYLSDEITTDQIRMASSLVSNPDIRLLSHTLEDYLADVSKHIRQQTYKAKEKRIRDFMAWLKVDKEPHHVTKKDAGLFLTHELAQRTLSTKSIKDFLSDLSAFFNWMEGRGFVESNPFRGLAGTVRNTSRGMKDTSRRREWKEQELLALLGKLKSKKDHKLMAFTLIALYSGMRSNEIAEMEVSDVNDACFHIPEGKTESSIRDVPIHPIIKPLVQQLKANSTDGYLISGLKRGGEDLKRNHYIVKRFGTLKNGAGVTDSNVVFHSLRKNFSGEMERADVQENLAQQIVGHKKQSLTYGLYSDGVKVEKMMDAVSKVSHGQKVDELVKELIAVS